MSRAALAALVVLSATPAIAGPCRILGLAPDVLTPPGATVIAGGAVVVTAGPANVDARDDASIQPAWRWKIGDQLVEPLRTTLAPGLTAYALPAGAAGATVARVATLATLEDAQHARRADVTIGGDAKVLPAPQPKALTQVPAPTGARGPESGTTVALVLAAPAPAGAIAIVVYGADGAPRDWEAIGTPGSTTFGVSHVSGRCETAIPGRVQSHAGDKLQFAWVDASGRLSAKSAAITVKP